MAYKYVVQSTEDECQPLRWLSSRYESAEILYNHEDGGIITLPESVAWDYLDSLKEENGNPNQIIPTCIGGKLADKLVDLWERIV